MDYNISDFILQKEEVQWIKWITKDNLISQMKQLPADFTPWFHKWVKELKLL